MKAIRYHAPEDLRLDDIPEPSVGPKQVKVKVNPKSLLVLKCHTDPHSIRSHGNFIVSYGMVVMITKTTMCLIGAVVSSRLCCRDVPCTIANIQFQFAVPTCTYTVAT